MAGHVIQIFPGRANLSLALPDKGCQGWAKKLTGMLKSLQKSAQPQEH